MLQNLQKIAKLRTSAASKSGERAKIPSDAIRRVGVHALPHHLHP